MPADPAADAPGPAPGPAGPAPGPAGPAPDFAAGPSRAVPARTPVVDARTPAVEVRRSARRSRTVSARREGDRVVVFLPARMSAEEEEHWVAAMLERLAAREKRRPAGDDALARRAEELSGRYLAGRARPLSVRWVTNQTTRWGSCTPAEGTVRLSHRLQGMPEYVVDYVLLHELAHLLVPGHGPRFWELLEAYPLTERARGYLEGVVAAAGLPHLPDPCGQEAPPTGLRGPGDGD
ncbi:M48 family metallopeptidase [Streptomyces thermolineatus]|uniref:M48 family metallopeptidase n=1 Tax=Streptomyces thermolineatus TaxID=44033 RepID=A0ABN3KWI0_9ACTN